MAGSRKARFQRRSNWARAVAWAEADIAEWQAGLKTGVKPSGYEIENAPARKVSSRSATAYSRDDLARLDVAIDFLTKEIGELHRQIEALQKETRKLMRDGKMRTEFLLLAIYNKPRLNIDETCQALGMSTATGYTHRSLGKFPVAMSGSPLTADIRDVAEALDLLRGQGKAGSAERAGSRSATEKLRRAP